ncbi:methylmalonyl Co-A mutase-associated GTPase MeaB [Candidatus Aminicenantes bacterium AC-335-A11]|jgi:LAO/AO transport system kinase|nr:methylmalonyl Co-A mutase-associated GTPase MeaB [SCandidatus Aminicenantes bacterium Aminicenantia_JdfR_composite]MCP2598027.1 methylmalonyl Co-A mutase-associated GTPase MeaB [Candidatus Aminicenantes bacterium AC-335-L06]MCP2619069.1 methylmalonyl Co-A mutase-associated GTPase MeaB [Candidatus Aminicenantes bacterium AC-335-A11]
MDLVQEVLKGNQRAIAKMISLVENEKEKAYPYLRKLYLSSNNSLVIGITGSPGSGKSTLIDQMVFHLRKNKKSIGIIAIDPTSPFTGGAILGDRIRMMRHSLDSEVFIRSMATRGHLGGLAKSTGEVITILEASGKDVIIIETVGVGQDEVEIVKYADIVLVILIPGAGDEIQSFKAGIMEIGDIFVINKADHPDTPNFERQLQAILSLGLKEKEKKVPVIKTIATTGEGVSELVDKILNFESRDIKSRIEERRKRFIRWMLEDILKEVIYNKLRKRIPEDEFNEYIEKIYEKEIDPFTLSEKLVKEIMK